MEYHQLSGLFSSVEGLTIAKYIIRQRIEKAKELLMYAELTLSEIADKLGYSSVQHHSQQFKKTTGLTPSHFKNLDRSSTPTSRIFHSRHKAVHGVTLKDGPCANPR